MSFVQHDNGVLFQVTVDEALPQQHTIRHVLDEGLLRGHVLEPNGVANLGGGGYDEDKYMLYCVLPNTCNY